MNAAFPFAGVAPTAASDTLREQGVAQVNAGQHEAGLATLTQVLQQNPTDARALAHVADALVALSRGPEAERRLREGLALGADGPESRERLARLLASQGRLADAERLLQDTLRRGFASETAIGLLGKILYHSGRLTDAESHLRAACGYFPEDADLRLMLAETLRLTDRYAEAVPEYERCIELDPTRRVAYVNLAGIFKSAGRVTAALALARRAVAVDPSYAMGYAAIAEGLLASGEAAAAMVQLERALGCPDVPAVAISNYLMVANYVPEVDATALALRHRDLAARFAAAPVAHAPRPASQRVRVGFVSADLREHSVAYFIEPLLANHDRTRFEFHCYDTATTHDATTERLRRHVHAFHRCAHLDDDGLAGRIRDDGIDVLIDLNGHTAGHRLGVFARRAAPVQATYLGYPTGTGLAAMDYRLTDCHLDPEGLDQPGFEVPLRLAAGAFCYRPPEDAPAVAARPADGVTFGCFNSVAKLSDPVIEAWAEILGRLPGARLRMKSKGFTDEAVRAGVSARLARCGISVERATLLGFESRATSHLNAYGRIDIALDTHPYNGATTTCEALWMGVPVVSWCGQTHASRMGRSILTAAGFPEWVAASRDEYVECAVALAKDHGLRSRLRRNMRKRLRASPLLAAEDYARAFEAACLAMVSSVSGKRVEHEPTS